MNTCPPRIGRTASGHRSARSTAPSRSGRLIEQLLLRFKHPEHGYRSPLGLLSLAKRHGRDRLEVACALALSLHSCNYRTVRDILTNGRDRLAPSVGADWISPQHEHLRGARSYH